MIIVTGSVTAAPESFETLLEACLAHTRRSRTEPGCISHAVHADCENPMRLFFYERWTDEEALRVHIRHPGSGELREAIKAHAVATERIAVYAAEEQPFRR